MGVKKEREKRAGKKGGKNRKQGLTYLSGKVGKVRCALYKIPFCLFYSAAPFRDSDSALRTPVASQIACCTTPSSRYTIHKSTMEATDKNETLKRQLRTRARKCHSCPAFEGGAAFLSRPPYPPKPALPEPAEGEAAELNVTKKARAHHAAPATPSRKSEAEGEGEEEGSVASVDSNLYVIKARSAQVTLARVGQLLKTLEREGDWMPPLHTQAVGSFYPFLTRHMCQLAMHIASRVVHGAREHSMRPFLEPGILLSSKRARAPHAGLLAALAALEAFYRTTGAYVVATQGISNAMSMQSIDAAFLSTRLSDASGSNQGKISFSIPVSETIGSVPGPYRMKHSAAASACNGESATRHVYQYTSMFRAASPEALSETANRLNSYLIGDGQDPGFYSDILSFAAPMCRKA